ncbi:hypothetical protein [Elioraea sp.]|uniref:hypothetical protein n=1 Tax=Elioraea sp. TaxID=2185103 RepID=UPI003F72C65E
MKLTRRELAPLALSIAAACASPVPPAIAQQRRPPPRALPPPPPMPAPRRAGDIGGLVLEGHGTPAGTVMLVGHAFPPGALPRGHGVALRLVAGDRPIEAALQVLARHPDGSARAGLISLAAPALPRGGRAGVLIARVPAQGSAL